DGGGRIALAQGIGPTGPHLQCRPAEAGDAAPSRVRRARLVRRWRALRRATRRRRLERGRPRGYDGPLFPRGDAMKNALAVLTLAFSLPMLAATPGHAQMPVFNVGAVNNTGGLVVFVAVDKGFFAKHGIDGKVVVRNTGPEISKAL